MRGFARVLFLTSAVTACCAVAAGSAAGAVGDFDPTFGSGGMALAQVGLGSSPNSQAYSMALMPDGKVVLAGWASDAASPSHTAAGFARFTTAGVLDPSFGSSGNGTFVTQFGVTASPSSQVTIAGTVAQPDGRVVVSGYATDAAGNTQVLVARFTGAGALDPSFASGGKLVQQLGSGAGPTPTSQGGGIVLQGDGKILLTGYATDAAGNNQVFVERLTSGGAPDSSFGSGGVRFRQYGAGATPASMGVGIMLQPDGSPVIVGDATASNGDPAALIARFTPSGQTDAGFGGGGKVVQLGLHTASGTNFSELVTVQSQQGNFVASGVADDSSGNEAFVLARFTSTGNLDSSFGTGGKTVNQFSATPSNPVSAAYGAITQPNGKLVLVGGATDINNTAQVIVARYSANGALDPSFGTGGVVQGSSGPAVATGAAWLPDGKMVMSGAAADGASTFQFIAMRVIMDLPPTAGFTATPGSATTGQAVAFDASSSGDSDGTIAQVSWNFGDGASGTGTTVSHAYAQPGSYNVQATVTDDNGLTASASKTVTVSAVAAPVLPVLRIPGLSGLTLAPAAFPAAPGGASIARTTGTNIRYTDSAAGTTRFVVQRVLTGVKRGRSCVKRKAGVKGKSCTRFVTVTGSFSHVDVAGANSFHFTGRIGRHKLAVGKYRLVAQPRNTVGLGKKLTARFRITR
jgi:uncharacterized delta-60 repeat protein